MSENAQYWIWFQNVFGYSQPLKKILRGFGSVKDLYNAGITEWKMSPDITATQVKKLSSSRLEDTEEVIYTCENNGWHIIDYDDAAYPQRLKEIADPPAVLYVDGEVFDYDNIVAISVVGTRTASNYAVRTSHLMSKGITEGGALVISGGAMGVDTYAHRGALSAGGKTVAVLGCGLGSKYLASNSSLRSQIRQHGALVTEYQPFVRAAKYMFPDRNRIISGLSLGVLVIEGGIKSGSLITAHHATEQNRDVFAIPASIISPDFAGTNELIRDGATVVLNPIDILQQYAFQYDSIDLSKVRTSEEIMRDYDERSLDTGFVKKVSAEKEKSRQGDPRYDKSLSFDNLDKSRNERKNINGNYSKLDKKLLKIFDAVGDEYKYVQDIIEETGYDSRAVISALAQLELLGMVKSSSGLRYKKF